jgi:hypothetical protein
MTPRSAHVAIALGIALPALAQQGPNDIEVLKKYAGTWAVDCTRPAGARLSIDVKSLAFVAGGQQLHTAAPLSAFSWFGKMEPPAGFEVALLGEGRPTGLTLLAMKDSTGPYLTVESDPLLQKQFGKPALAGKFRRCP